MFLPVVAANGDGTIGVTYYDTRRDVPWDGSYSAESLARPFARRRFKLGGVTRWRALRPSQDTAAADPGARPLRGRLSRARTGAWRVRCDVRIGPPPGESGRQRHLLDTGRGHTRTTHSSDEDPDYGGIAGALDGSPE
jgi:hypothetical protein